MVSEQEKQHVLLWHAVEGVGSKTLRALVRWSQLHQVSIAEMWQRPQSVPLLAQRTTLLNKQALVRQRHTAETYAEWLAEHGIGAVLHTEPDYSALLRESNNHPYCLYYKGAVKVLNHVLPIAVVGTRRITIYGAQATNQLAGDLARMGAQIVSGFMYGVDVTAHQAALAVGGSTVAVLGFGMTTMYPRSQQRLADDIVRRGGALVSPFAPRVEVRPGNFPARNAVVAALSKAVVVTEAAAQSGSLITAQHALEEGRAICAVSGPFDSVFALGTKRLLNQGATLVTCARDILIEVGALPGSHEQSEFGASGSTSLGKPSMPVGVVGQPELERVYQLITQTRPTVDELATALAQDITTVTHWVTQLELMGVIERIGLRYMVCYPPCS